MNISRVCMIGLIVIGGLAIWKYGNTAYNSARDYQTIGKLEVLATSSALWKDATIALSFERSVTQVSLSLEDPAPQAFLDLIQTQRDQADSLFNQAEESIQPLADLPTKQQFLELKSAALETVTQIRAEVDQMLSVRSADRDPKRTKNLPFELKKEIAELKSIANLMTIENVLTSNTAYALGALQNLAWEVREFGGRARTYYAIATLNGTAIPTEMISLIEADSSRAASAWSDIQKALLVADIDSSFRQKIDEAGAFYFNDYLNVIASLDQTMLDKSQNETITYPLTFDEFFATSNQALDGFVSLSRLAGEELRLYWDTRKAKSLRGLILDISAVIVSFALILAAMIFVSKRIAARIQYATSAIAEVANGNADQEVDSRSNDLSEIKDMTESLQKLIVGTRKAQDAMAALDDAEEREKERAEAEKDRQKLLETEAMAQKEKALAAERETQRLHAFEDFQHNMREVLGAASEGSFDQRMPTQSQDQGLADLAKIVNDVLSEMDQNISDIVTGIGELANGNLAIRLDGERQGVFLSMKNDFNAALEIVSSSMNTIMNSGESVTATSSELQSAASTMSTRAERDAMAVQKTSTAVDDMTRRIGQVVENAKAADEATQNIQRRANKTREIADTTEASMDNMHKASEEINRVVKVIEDIAFQINLLALNAGVEAARAGEAGRGFSVVASEVRSLAQRSQDAVQDVNRVIGENTTVVEGSIANVKASRDALEGIVSEVEIATHQISEIASSIEQQAVGIADINQAINAVESSSQNNAASLEELTASSISLNEDATSLSNALSKFHGVAIGDSMPNAQNFEEENEQQTYSQPRKAS
ncbi:MAG: methyl-accepting chemotaxis protein [Paracoccaceae bacterium]